MTDQEQVLREIRERIDAIAPLERNRILSMAGMLRRMLIADGRYHEETMLAFALVGAELAAEPQ